jgi:hypothetical protein
MDTPTPAMYTEAASTMVHLHACNVNLVAWQRHRLSKRRQRSAHPHSIGIHYMHMWAYLRPARSWPVPARLDPNMAPITKAEMTVRVRPLVSKDGSASLIGYCETK